MLLPDELVKNALSLAEAGDDIAAVSAICSWWNANASNKKADADHFGVYVKSQDDSYRNLLAEDRTLRAEDDLGPSGRAAGYEGAIFEIRRTAPTPECLIAFDLDGHAIESVPVSAGEDIFKKWSARALRLLCKRQPDRF